MHSSGCPGLPGLAIVRLVRFALRLAAAVRAGAVVAPTTGLVAAASTWRWNAPSCSSCASRSAATSRRRVTG
ncbi:hypothetical protein PF005_g22803 [Phytophthora fragariae]|uniref:Uncharacterized protein n=1 Tax=Phytophthora fragariae TaxID=53985 RepID=A0A6A4CAA4_9STRA|nr:hypothetical protein PF009_g8838 [Phytophthora fragariae]KAE9115701.1 hypothetical protein PF007_g9927 [Phytophthora fragariae]KAE9142110.1 hypothetical protein PF006_g12759 [Phytophthora fragariae]KAE9181644.1 hypothetical protein PF005_g22803 [Phytophthora fragariae]KAE9191527.1 hypothetical protein PF004_g21576 [Phytophthora fragariae]